LGGFVVDQKPVLQIRNLTKRINSKVIIDRLNFSVQKGEVFGFLGPNGAGKTTTIRMIVGLMAMTEGEILINGVSVSKQFERAMEQVGAIVENPEMYKYLTGYQNLIHFARMTPGVTKERIQEVIDLVGLTNRIHDKVRTYSLGMRQRLGVAQALLHKPMLLILDEPTNGLDPSGIRELRDYLRKLTREEGISVIVSSHLLSEMELICDRVAIIQKGKLVGVHGVRELVNQFDQRSVHSIVFDVDNPNGAKSILEKYVDKIPIKTTGTEIEIQIMRDQIPAINALLVRNNVNVFGIRIVTKSLEDRFLEMTRGEQFVTSGSK
jgi:ABC-2 type transport system ATP-binding protein